MLILFLSMSFSGSLLILALFLFRPLYKKRTSRRWQYYVWLIVIARLLLPFSFGESLFGMLMERAGQEGTAVQRSATGQESTAVQRSAAGQEGTAVQRSAAVQDHSTADDPERLPAPHDSHVGQQGVIRAAAEFLSGFGMQMLPHLGTVWIGMAVLFFLRKVTAYQSFLHFIKAGREEITDMQLLDQLAQMEEHVGVRHPVELYVNRLVASPMLLGCFRPCIVLPSADLSATDFRYTVWHELVHEKHLDLFYKWLMQITISLHWFNPLVRLMGKELERACELACDETVIRGLDERGRRDYGDTLLHAFEAGGRYKNTLTSVMLSEGAEQLKERLGAIMKFQRNSLFTVMLSVMLTAVLVCGAAAAGAAVPAKASSKQAESPAPVMDTVISDDNAKDPQAEASITGKKSRSSALSQAETYYKNKNLAAFGAAG